MSRERLGDSELRPIKQWGISGQCVATVRVCIDSVPCCMRQEIERGTAKSSSSKLFSVGTLHFWLPVFCLGIRKSIFKWNGDWQAKRDRPKARPLWVSTGGRCGYVGKLGVLQSCPHIQADPLLIHQEGLTQHCRPPHRGTTTQKVN